MENFKILKEKENPLFNRKEIQINVEAEITPSHEEAKKLISEKFSTQPENIRIKKITGKFGSKVFAISANIYSSEEEKNKTEIFSKKEKEREKKLEPENMKKNAEQDDVKNNTPLKEEQKISNEIAEQESKKEKVEEIKQREVKKEEEKDGNDK